MTRAFFRLSVLILSLFAGVSQGCATGPQTSDQDLRFINKASVEALMQHPVEKDGKANKVVLVDVRPAEAYKKRHIAGAINMPLADLHAGDPRLTSADVIVVYAGGWQDLQSAAGAKKLIALGYHNVREFRGGLASWEHKGSSAPAPGGAAAP